MIPHDAELYGKALKLKGYDYAELERLESLCLTEQGAVAIHDIAVRLYHKEEYQAELL